MKIKTIISVTSLALIAMFFLPSEITGQTVIETSEVPVDANHALEHGSDEIHISSEMLRRLAPEGGIVVLPTVDDLTRQLERALIEDPFHSFNYGELANSLRVALRSDFLTDYMQLQAKQKNKLSEILESHQDRVTDLFAEAKKATDPEVASAMYAVVDEEKVAFSASIKEQLTVDQQSKFPFYHPSEGTAKLLLKSNLGDALKLTDAQKQQIHTQSKKLAKELEEFLQAKRKESVKILAGVLTEKQLKQLKEVRGEKGVTDNSDTTFSALIRNHKIDSE